MTLFDIIYLLTCALTTRLSRPKWKIFFRMNVVIAAGCSATHNMHIIFITPHSVYTHFHIKNSLSLRLSCEEILSRSIEGILISTVWNCEHSPAFHFITTHFFFYQSNLTVVFISLLLALLFCRPLKTSVSKNAYPPISIILHLSLHPSELYLMIIIRIEMENYYNSTFN